MKLLNTELLANPYNWIVVFLMCAFAMVGLALIFPQSDQD
jgi:hypothetical protein